MNNEKKDNKLLVCFDFVVNTYMGYCKLYEKNKTELEIIKDDVCLKDHGIDYSFPYQMKKDILLNSKAYDTFGLFITILKEASSVDIDFLCRDKLEEKYLKSLNPSINTIVSSRHRLDISDYTAIYVKRYEDILRFKHVRGKYVYIANIRSNMDDDKPSIPDLDISILISDVNVVRVMDLYKDYKYIPRKEDNKNE